MSSPVRVDLPHNLGAQEARRRIAGGVGKLQAYLPGAADIRPSWTGDRLDLEIAMMGQEVKAQVHVQEHLVRVELALPPALAFFGKAIEAAVKRKGTDLLEDKSDRP